MGCPTIVTDRLVLRPLGRDDLDQLAMLHAEKSFWYYPYRRGWSRDETSAFIERAIDRYDDTGLMVAAVVLGDTGELAGWAGLSVPTLLPEILPTVEVGWRLGEQFRGRGIATEAGSAWVRHGFTVLGLERIVSIYEPENTASGAVMRRLGFSPDFDTAHPVYGMPVRVQSLSHEHWTRLVG